MSQVMIKWRRRASHLGRFTLWHNGRLWRPVLVKIMTIKLHRKSILIQLQQILWTCCVFFSSLNNTFLSVLIIIFSNKSYFCFKYTKYFFHSCHELFFSGTSNYFSNVYQELFFNWAKNYSSQYRKFIFWYTVHCGPCLDWFDLWPFWKLWQVEEYFQRECQGKTLSEKETKEVFISYKICQELVVCR